MRAKMASGRSRLALAKDDFAELTRTSEEN